MTLSTHILVKEPVPIEPLFQFCQSLLSPAPETQRWSLHDPDPNFGGYFTNPSYWNDGGQGLPAWLILYYGADGPLRYETDQCYCEPGECTCADDAARYTTSVALIDFDTAYGYRSPSGAGCADLHAWLVVMVASWLDNRGARCEWRDEFRGEWHESVLDISVLGDAERGAVYQPAEVRS